jgi:hypothetical protein
MADDTAGVDVRSDITVANRYVDFVPGADIGPVLLLS